jgi:hypothetical protein
MLVLVFVLSGAVLASNMGFKLNFGILNAINRLFCPSGYDQQGEWTGQGSGVSFSVSMPEEGTNALSLDMRTPAGTFSVPYAYEKKCPRGPGRMRPLGVVIPDPYMRYSGTNLNYNPEEPLTFTSADGVAQITIESSAECNPMVRYSGTGLCIGTGTNQANIYVTPDTITLTFGEGAAVPTETWKLGDKGWERQPGPTE